MKKENKQSLIVLMFFVLVFTFKIPFVTIENGFCGEKYYGTVFVENPTTIGNIDIAFHLDIADGVIRPQNSYIIPEKTLIFPAAAQVNGQDAGPMVESGTYDIETFHLVTKPFSADVSGKNVTRQITLDGAADTARGDSISGTYTESITGYLPEPFSITGTFVLVRPTSSSQEAFSCQYLDTTAPFGDLSLEEIKAGGDDPFEVEFADIGCAMYYRQHSDLGVSVSDTVIEAATAAYQQYLQSVQP